eukprot:CAMPEP_0179035266 /NCGR_PEP_ID=MMETSP0796-20121207/13024_1 /TAXON_ID=73915 /ORGANISM="Pyrodinium bahamense, Strain pbaha01" /LENGTH=698 /DNA_ID=CAMNT_0020731537 /DNA_START=79 /DNA_END=2175 /DNA_ORIENTATION=+
MQLAMKSLCFALVATLLVPSQAVRQSVAAAANPIRKVVTMLQAMQKKVEAEGAKEKELYEAFVCYCKKGDSDLAASIATAEAKMPAVASNIKTAEEKLAQSKGALKEAQVDREAAKDAMAAATAIREKEAAAFAEEKAELDANIAMIAKAVAALEKGMAGSFLQTAAAQRLRQLVLNKQDMLDVDREELASFLSAKEGSSYAPKSGEITGILKQMGDTMAKHLAESTATEDAAIKTYESLLAAKAKEVEALVASIEAKTEQIGKLGVDIVQMKEDLSDTEAANLEDGKLLAGLKESCATKKTEWDERSKTRAAELVALAETIKILNDDDALELFKKTLPSASASFMQMQVNYGASRARALAVVREARRAAGRPESVGLDLLALALTGKKALSQGGFEKVLKMCDDMVAVLKTEQDDDDHKKEYCLMQFDTTDDKKKALERTVSDEEKAIDQAKDGLAAVAEEIKALEASITALDKSVAEATEQRKEENAEYKELMASDAAAKELLAFAKNRLNQFYNPKLYKPPAKAELSAEGRIAANMGGAVLAQVAAHEQRRSASAAPPPETWTAYATKEESTGVIDMINLLIKDLNKEMTEAEAEEKDAQAEYEALMKDSVEKRSVDSKTLKDKIGAKAALEGDLMAHEEAKASAGKQLMATLTYIQSLHSECDWLLKYYEVRKEAREGEVESLKQAKAVLSGAE